jgi:hypothetical protein
LGSFIHLYTGSQHIPTLTKRVGSGSVSRGRDTDLWIRIRTKMSRIPNTAFQGGKKDQCWAYNQQRIEPLKYKFEKSIQIFNPNPGEEDPPDLD